MYDTKLPFGARASPTIFHRISQAIKRMMLKRGHNLIVAYQDDFLVIGASFRECEKALIALQSLLCDLGFEINKEKTVNPTKCLTFLGIQFNTLTCELALPESKLQDIRGVLCEFSCRKRSTKRDIQRLVGKLNFCS